MIGGPFHHFLEPDAEGFVVSDFVRLVANQVSVPSSEYIGGRMLTFQ